MKITHDFHVHTHLSICANETATVENYIANAKRLGLTKIGFSDHFGDGNIPGARGFYRAHPYEHNAELKETLANIHEPDIKFYFGCETEYHTPKRDIALTEEEAEKFDFIVVPNSHTHMIMPKEYIGNYDKHVEFMIQAYEDILNSPLSRYVTAMAHPFDICCHDYTSDVLINMIPDDTFKRLFDKTAEKGIAFELNMAYSKTMTPEDIANDCRIRMVRIAKECGCKFTFGSDSHSSSYHDFYHNADILADILGLTENDLADICK